MFDDRTAAIITAAETKSISVIAAEYNITRQRVAQILKANDVKPQYLKNRKHRCKWCTAIMPRGRVYCSDTCKFQGNKRRVLVDGKRQCTRCREWKNEAEEFYVSSALTGRRYPHCRKCHNELCMANHKRNRQ